MPYRDKTKQAEFIKNTSRTVTVRFVNTTDADLVTWLDKQERPSTSIKEVLREYVHQQK